MSEPGFFGSLEGQLDDGFARTVARRTSRRRVLGRAAGATLGLLALVVVVAVVVDEEPAEAGVSVEQRGGLLYVRLTDIEYRPDVIEEAAAGAGLAVSVEAVPTGPSLVGRFIRFEQAGADTGELRELDRDGPAFSGFTIPAGYDGTLVLQVGRPARSDEVYRHFANALSPGEPLACSGIIDVAPHTAVEIVRARGVDARWTILTERGLQPVDESALAGEDFAQHRTASAFSIADNTVTIYVSDGRARPPPVELTADATC